MHRRSDFTVYIEPTPAQISVAERMIGIIGRQRRRYLRALLPVYADTADFRCPLRQARRANFHRNGRPAAVIATVLAVAVIGFCYARL